MLRLVLAILLVFWSDALLAQSNASPRGATHEGFGRIVFDWDGAVDYSADIVNDQLVVRFNRPVRGDFHRLIRPLSKYLRGVSVSGDRKTATFPLARPVQVKTSTSDHGSVIIDLVDAPKDEAQAPPASPPPLPEGEASGNGNNPVSLLPTSPPPGETSGHQPPASQAPAASEKKTAPRLDVRVGEHGGYNRMVFAWPRAVNYRVDQNGESATLTFARDGSVDLPALRSQMPPDIQVKSAETDNGKTTLTFDLPKGARIRHFKSGTKVVMDVVRDANAPAPAGVIPLPAGNDAEPGMPSLKPLAPEDLPSLPSEGLKQEDHAKEAQGKPAETPAPAQQDRKAPPPPPPAPAEPASTDQSASEDEGETFSLSIPWEKPVAAAVFQRAGYLWIVFDRHEDVNTSLLRRLGGSAVTFVDQLKSRDATILRLIVQPDFRPSVRRDGLLWVVDLSHHTGGEPKRPIGIAAPAALPSGTGIALDVEDAGNVVSVEDPEVGDTMLVVPVMPLGAGVYPGRDTPNVRLLPTAQGIALVPHMDGLDVKSGRTGVTVGSTINGGLLLSAEPNRQVTGAAPVTAFFDIPTWMRGGAEHFMEERRIIDQDLADVPPARRAAAQLSAARFYFANGYAAEALGYLRLAAENEPTLVDTGAFRALRGAANAAMHRWDEAIDDLDNPLVKDDAEADFWKAVAHSGKTDNLVPLEGELAKGLPFIKGYPKILRWPLAVLIANAALAAADDSSIMAALDMIDRMAESSAEKGRREYLRGLNDEILGKYDKALERYAKAEESDDREARARSALAEVNLRLKTKTIDVLDAEKRLDSLRFAWRDEEFEFSLLKRLAQLQEQTGDYPEALRSLRALANYYPNNKGTPEVAQEMQDIFAKLYLDGAADSLPPVSAIGLYDEFRDLTPMGAKGDEMIRKLADRLVSVDLLDRAAELLKHQVTYRLQGADKVRVGTQLAVLELLDQKPQETLDALAASEAPGISPDLQAQRRHLKADALANVDRVPEAIALLVGDPSPEAALLRAEIYWRKQDWHNAAQAFAAMVKRPQGDTELDDASARLVLSWATALILGNDEHGLGALRRTFGDAMDKTTYKDGFTLLTSALDHTMPDMPKVAEKIKEAEGFQTFLSDYKARLRKEGLSHID